MNKRWLSTCCSPKGLLLIAVLALGAGFLVRAHGYHLLAWLPYLIFLACPLMHLFMHHHHGGKERSAEDNDK
ncbi:DUF2933 domain-containing protein [Marinobacterium mangrovicola]|uniref:DUF2933 family protein n=1 Tax=Marinobacterium mangrovicola TaxID=1476959 RepID=A0A4V2PCS0_9GAMM|nr:DUF2933 domain-containing protein [Marinobacterium mangrovicola]TCK02336.1 Protein of unknown function (DUF2933) [Marinobacterium mangrovicola]